MMILARLWLLVLFVWQSQCLAYRLEAGEYYVSSGFGMNLNAVRMDLPSQTPGAQLPLFVSIDYLIDNNLGAFFSVVPTFAAGSAGLSLRAGAKYWFTRFEFPLYPYASLALAPSFTVPSKGANHWNLGISPGFGATYFVVSKFMVGVHMHFNPSIAWAGDESKFELSVMPFFDLSLRI